MRTIQNQFEKGMLKKETLLLGTNIPKIKEIPKEVVELSEKYDNFGINNSTATLIKEASQKVKTKTREQNQKQVKNEGLQRLMTLFFPFKIITYKTIDSVASDYNLIISSLSYYNKPIAGENVQDLQNFKDLMASKMDELKSLFFPRGHRFSFGGEIVDFDNVYHIDFTNYFNVVAPKSHFDFKEDNVLQIGREIKQHEKKPGFKLNLKVNIPEPRDPIIIAPFIYLDVLYSFVVTAWDEVADDERIRSMIK